MPVIAKRTKLTADRLRELVTYEARTGVFLNRVRRSNNCLAGQRLGNVSKGYEVFFVDGERYRAHRLAWLYVTGRWPDDQIDHINGDRRDNRFCNLRQADKSQNAGNQKVRSDSLSGFKGVHFRKTKGKFVAQIHLKGRDRHLGYFDTAEQASEAYQKAAAETFGEYAAAAIRAAMPAAAAKEG